MNDLGFYFYLAFNIFKFSERGIVARIVDYGGDEEQHQIQSIPNCARTAALPSIDIT
jgi:hypothetical protein